MNVIYFPLEEDEDVCRFSDQRGLPATVAYQRHDGRVDIVFRDDIGKEHRREAVQILDESDAKQARAKFAHLDYCVVSPCNELQVVG